MVEMSVVKKNKKFLKGKLLSIKFNKMKVLLKCKVLHEDQF